MDVVEQSKSPNDQKKYRLLTLSNALEVLLISTAEVTRRFDDEGDEDEPFSDTEADDDEDVNDDDESTGSADEDFDSVKEGDHGRNSRRAGACLTVGVGSFADPAELPGLAHYLEHMLFMGSEKYPDENEFEAFLSAHGGFSNGSTDNEVTSYTFEVGPAYLETALDMFAHFFISPLLKAEAMDRELSAIDSEFSQATQNDRIRIQQVLCDISKPSHPYHRFGWGNRKSLQELPEMTNVDVRKEILQFYERYYSANIMKLVVCGEDTLDDLEKWVTTSFSRILNKQVVVPSYASYGQPFGATVDPTPLLCRIVPIRDIHTLHLNWMIPPIFGFHHQKPADYIASLLGHESEGSILSHLKQRGWISALSAGVTDNDGYDSGTYAARFDITMKLTLDSLVHWENIVLVVFEYLLMLRSSEIPEWVFEELKALADISFRFQEESSAVEKCEELAQIMQDIFQVAPQDLLRYDLFQGSFQKDLVVEMLKFLNPDNLVVTIVSQTHDDIPSADVQMLEEKWFGVKYNKEEISNDVRERWKNASVNSSLHLPKANPFIPRDFALIDTSESEDISFTNSLFGKMWYKPDREFATPRAHVGFLLRLPSVIQSVENCVFTELYVKLVRDALNEYSYHANVAELMYSLRIKESGLELLFGGYNEKLMLLVEVVIHALFSTEIQPARFDVIKEDLLREYKNSIVKGSHKAKYLRLQLLEQVSFPLDQSISALNTSSVEMLKTFVSTKLWKSKAYLTGFAHGNISPATAEKARKLMEIQLERVSSPLLPSELTPRHINSIPPTPTGFLLKERSEHKEEKNSHVELYYQIGEHNLRNLAYADLLHQLMEEPLFDTLRTKEELGYDVSCTVRITHGILGFGVMVESSLFPVARISSCVDRFMVDFVDAIAAMSDEHFQDHIQAQILKKLEPNHNLFETTHRYWYEISSGRLLFDIDTLLAKELESCTKSEMIQRYHDWILDSPKKLSVHVIGRGSKAEKQAKKNGKSSPGTKVKELQQLVPTPVRIMDLYAFKADLPYYPDRTVL